MTISSYMHIVSTMCGVDVNVWACMDPWSWMEYDLEDELSEYMGRIRRINEQEIERERERDRETSCQSHWLATIHFIFLSTMPAATTWSSQAIPISVHISVTLLPQPYACACVCSIINWKDLAGNLYDPLLYYYFMGRSENWNGIL